MDGLEQFLATGTIPGWHTHLVASMCCFDSANNSMEASVFHNLEGFPGQVGGSMGIGSGRLLFSSVDYAD